MRHAGRLPTYLKCSNSHVEYVNTKPISICRQNYFAEIYPIFTIHSMSAISNARYLELFATWNKLAGPSKYECRITIMNESCTIFTGVLRISVRVVRPCASVRLRALRVRSRVRVCVGI